MTSKNPEHFDRAPYNCPLGTNVLLREEPHEEDDDEEDEDNGREKEKDIEDDEEDGGYSVFCVSTSFVFRSGCKLSNNA
jgi:hypothetical protein